MVINRWLIFFIYINLLKCYNDIGDKMALDYKLGSIVTMKKGHPCGTNKWEITRIGADIKIKCLECGRIIMLPRVEFNKKLKKVINNEVEEKDK